MIYVSSSCVRVSRISEAVKILAEAGFRSIELSGGTDYYPDLEADLLELKKKYALSFLCHNYFPPPVEPIVVNLASLDGSIHTKSMNHLFENIRVSRMLGADRISFHAGFFIDIVAAEIGRELGRGVLVDRKEAIDRFCRSYNALREEAGDLSIYVENNVYSWANKQVYGADSPFMLLTYDDFLELKRKIDFRLLLDVGHLRVSCNSLGIDFREELSRLFPYADYLHISDNDGVDDSHGPISEEGTLYNELKELDFSNKVVSLEVCGDMDELQNTYALIDALAGNS